MVLLGDEAQVKARSIWKSCKSSCKIVAQFASDVPWAQKSFWTQPMELIGELGHVKSRFFSFGDSVSVGAR